MTNSDTESMDVDIKSTSGARFGPNASMGEPNTSLVFVSGLGGFNRIDLGVTSAAYFRGVDAMLKRRGITAFFPSQRPFASVAERAEYLARQLSSLPYERLALVAHSMGGLDSRYYIQRFDRDRRVRALATVATPHRGTPLAEWFLESRRLIPLVGRSFMREALEELTRPACERFNCNVPDRDDVLYLSYAGVRSDEESPCFFRPWIRLIDTSTPGGNDSQVSLHSAAWGTLKQVVRADHFELVGWSFGARNKHFERPFQHLALYALIAHELLASIQHPYEAST